MWNKSKSGRKKSGVKSRAKGGKAGRLMNNKTVRWAILIGGAAVFVLLIAFSLGEFGLIDFGGEPEAVSDENADAEATKAPKKPHRVPKLDYKVDLLTPNRFSRPQLALKEVNGVVVHYVSNPGTTAKDNRDYFNNLPIINEGSANPRFASAHFVIGLEGEILQCIPLSEMAYASNSRNTDTVAIECCHPKKDGKFNDKTYASLIEALTYLCLRYDLDPEKEIIRHYDITGKMCPRYYVKHPDAWLTLKKDVAEQVKKTGEALYNGTIEYDMADANGKILEDKKK